MAALIVILISSLLILAAVWGLVDAGLHLAAWTGRRLARLAPAPGRAPRLVP